MKHRPLSSLLFHYKNTASSESTLFTAKTFMASTVPETLESPLESRGNSNFALLFENDSFSNLKKRQEKDQIPLVSRNSSGSDESHIERAWTHWKKLGEPKFIVAPMVDNSELPFRLLCRKYGAVAAYTPMLHSRVFLENQKYRSEEFTTCEEDRPLFVQFCANDPDTLLNAAKIVEPYCDYVDINLGCPQRIAKRGNYGAFLMDNLPLIKSLIQKLASNLTVPISCKIRIFPDHRDTINYALMLQDAGCSLLAIHGRTRVQKDCKNIRADWSIISAVKNALKIPILANGNVRHLDDVFACLEETGAHGVLSAESLLENPSLFAGFRTAKLGFEDGKLGFGDGGVDQSDLVKDYLNLCEKYSVPWRMIRSHVHKMLGEWFRVHPEVREDLNGQDILSFEYLHGMVDRLREAGPRIPLYAKDAEPQLDLKPEKIRSHLDEN